MASWAGSAVCQYRLESKLHPTSATHSRALITRVSSNLLSRLWQGSLAGLATQGRDVRCCYRLRVFPQGNENKGFHLAKQITLGIDAFAFPSLKAVGNGTCVPCDARDVIEMSRGVKCSSLLASQMALPCACCRAESTGGRCLGHCLKNSPS